MTNNPPLLPKRDLIAECLPERDHFMAPAWIGLIRFAASRPDCIQAFEKDSGMTFSLGSRGIEAMIDEATGYTETIVFEFAKWVTKNLWGDTTQETDE